MCVILGLDFNTCQFDSLIQEVCDLQVVLETQIVFFEETMIEVLHNFQVKSVTLLLFPALIPKYPMVAYYNCVTFY